MTDQQTIPDEPAPGEPTPPAPEDADPADVDPAESADAPADAGETAEASQASFVDWEALAAADERTPGQVLAALGDATRERDEYLDALRRKQAEFENFRKRMVRDGAGQRIAGHAEVAERLLDVLDDFDRTLSHAEGVDPGFLKGVGLVHDKLTGTLRDFGLQRIDDEGAVFDPARHEAVQQFAADEPVAEPLVHQVLRPGYELGGRVLRAAMVAVRQ